MKVIELVILITIATVTAIATAIINQQRLKLHFLY